MLLSPNLGATSDYITLAQQVVTFMPFERNEGMVNREAIFKDLDLRLTASSRNRSVAIWGLGGCGYVMNMLVHDSMAYMFLVRHRSPSNMLTAVKKKLHVRFSGSTQILRLDSLKTMVNLPRSLHYLRT